MPEENPGLGQYQVVMGPQTVVLQINLGGPFLVIPLSHENILQWALEIKRQQKAALQLVGPNGSKLRAN